jgi:hypothetical protein
MKQTAVEWLMERITYDNGLGQRRNSYSDSVNLSAYFEQAKEMEKEQIINANRDGVDMVVDKKDFISGEQYYKETFNTNEK